MKINIKTLKGTDFFDLNVEETTTVMLLFIFNNDSYF